MQSSTLEREHALDNVMCAFLIKSLLFTVSLRPRHKIHFASLSAFMKACNEAALTQPEDYLHQIAEKLACSVQSYRVVIIYKQVQELKICLCCSEIATWLADVNTKSKMQKSSCNTNPTSVLCKVRLGNSQQHTIIGAYVPIVRETIFDCLQKGSTAGLQSAWSGLGPCPYAAKAP